MTLLELMRVNLLVFFTHLVIIRFIDLFAFSQFADVAEFAENMANDGKIVIVAALDATFQRKVSSSLLFFGFLLRHSLPTSHLI